MIDNNPRCRLCGNQLKAIEGCALCLEMKQNLIWPAVSDEDSDLSATAIIKSTLRALKGRLKKLNTEITAEKKEYNPALTRDLGTISRALKELAAEQRKLEDREEAKYAKLGIAGRMDLFINEFFSVLPEDFQVKLLSDMRDRYEKQNTPLLPEAEIIDDE